MRTRPMTLTTGENGSDRGRLRNENGRESKPYYGPLVLSYLTDAVTLLWLAFPPTDTKIGKSPESAH
jgi:hypothetical protein